MEPNLILTALFLISAAFSVITAEYVRPQPRKDLQFPWDSKPSSQPQQVSYSFTLHFSLF